LPWDISQSRTASCSEGGRPRMRSADGFNENVGARGSYRKIKNMVSSILAEQGMGSPNHFLATSRSNLAFWNSSCSLVLQISARMS